MPCLAYLAPGASGTDMGIACGDAMVAALDAKAHWYQVTGDPGAPWWHVLVPHLGVTEGLAGVVADAGLAPMRAEALRLLDDAYRALEAVQKNAESIGPDVTCPEELRDQYVSAATIVMQYADAVGSILPRQQAAAAELRDTLTDPQQYADAAAGALGGVNRLITPIAWQVGKLLLWALVLVGALVGVYFLGRFALRKVRS